MGDKVTINGKGTLTKFKSRKNYVMTKQKLLQMNQDFE